MADTPTPTLTDEQISNAVRNDYGDKHFTLGDRAFPVMDLDYDSYIDFVRTAKPIIEAVAGALEVGQDEKGEVGLQLNPLGIDYDAILTLAGKELPHMAWICCKQSDPKITEKNVKQLAKRPQKLLEVVLFQIKHNDLLEEFASFFPRMMAALTDLAPAVQNAVMPTSMTEGTPSS